MEAEATEEVKRAAELFIKSDSEVRLAIAVALRGATESYRQAPRMWDACGPDDYETRHHLLWWFADGIVDGDSGKRAAEARGWMLKEAHPSMAEPLLRALCNSKNLLSGMTAKEEEQVLQFLMDLYRQPGDMVCWHPATPEDLLYCGDSGPISCYVIRAFGKVRTKRSFDKFVGVLLSDGKKADRLTRFEMWLSMSKLSFSVPADALLGIAQRREFAEAWLMLSFLKEPPTNIMSASPGAYQDATIVAWNGYGHESVRDAFRTNVVKQVANPDARVVKGALLGLVRSTDDKGLLEQVARLQLTTRMRTVASQLLNEMKPEDVDSDRSRWSSYEKQKQQIAAVLKGSGRTEGQK